MKPWSIILSSLLFASGCLAGESTPDPAAPLPPNGPGGEAVFDDTWHPAPPTSGESVDLEPGDVRLGRAGRRMSVDQIRASVEDLLGVTWVDSRINNPENMFVQLASTLGKPDYLGITEESLDPTPTFVKFMDDMAGQVCRAAVRGDLQGAADRKVVFDAADVAGTVRTLRLKFHGIHAPDLADPATVALAELHAAILGDTGSAEDAWTGVCIALLTAPEFMIY